MGSWIGRKEWGGLLVPHISPGKIHWLDHQGECQEHGSLPCANGSCLTNAHFSTVHLALHSVHLATAFCRVRQFRYCGPHSTARSIHQRKDSAKSTKRMGRALVPPKLPWRTLEVDINQWQRTTAVAIRLEVSARSVDVTWRALFFEVEVFPGALSFGRSLSWIQFQFHSIKCCKQIIKIKSNNVYCSLPNSNRPVSVPDPGTQLKGSNTGWIR